MEPSFKLTIIVPELYNIVYRFLYMKKNILSLCLATLIFSSGHDNVIQGDRNMFKAKFLRFALAFFSSNLTLKRRSAFCQPFRLN